MNGRSIRNGAMGGAAMALFYVIVVGTASGSLRHLEDQARGDWYLIAVVVAGFGTQVALLSELRRRHRMHAAAAVAGGTGAGASAAGMIACCAHHIADLLPFVGLSGAATFLYDYRLPFVLVGVGINTLGVALAAHRLRRIPVVHPREEAGACVAA